MHAKFLKWFLFSVVGGGLWTLLAALMLLLQGKAIDFVVILGQGRLLPVVASLSGSALANALEMEGRPKLRMGVGFVGFMIALSVTGVIGWLSGTADIPSSVQPRTLAIFSLVAYVTTFVVGCASLVPSKDVVKP